jgi:hypothetical protein
MGIFPGGGGDAVLGAKQRRRNQGAASPGTAPVHPAQTGFVDSFGSCLASGGFIFYNTNVLNKYTSTADRMEMRAEYERRYGQYEHTTQPVLARTSCTSRSIPTRERLTSRGTYHLVNRSKVAIDSIHLSTIPHGEIKPFHLTARLPKWW